MSSEVKSLVWLQSSVRCANGGCVEVARSEDEVWVRDSKLGGKSPILKFTPDEWGAWVGGVKNGEFDNML